MDFSEDGLAVRSEQLVVLRTDNFLKVGQRQVYVKIITIILLLSPTREETWNDDSSGAGDILHQEERLHVNATVVAHFRSILFH